MVKKKIDFDYFDRYYDWAESRLTGMIMYITTIFFTEKVHYVTFLINNFGNVVHQNISMCQRLTLLFTPLKS